MYRTILSALILLALIEGDLLAQVVSIPRPAERQIQDAVHLRSNFDDLEKGRQSLRDALKRAREVLAVTEELQFLSQSQMENAISDALQQLNTRKYDHGHPFTYQQTDREWTLYQNGVDAKQLVADVDHSTFKIGIQQLSEVLDHEQSNRKEVGNHAVQILDEEQTRWKKNDLDSRRLLPMPVGSRSQLKQDQFKSIRDQYKQYVEYTIDIGSLDVSTNSREFREHGRRLLHNAIMEIEDRLQENATNRSAFQRAAAAYYKERVKERVPGGDDLTPNSAEEISIEKTRLLAQLAYIESLANVDSQGSTKPLVDPTEILSSIDSGSAAVKAHQRLEELVRQWNQELNDQSTRQQLRNRWNQIRMDSIQDWNSQFFNSSAELDGEKIRVELISQRRMLADINPQISKSGRGRGGRVRRGYNNSQPVATTLSSYFPSENSPAWRISCGDGECYLTLAAPKKLNSRSSSRNIDYGILEYLSASGKIQQIDVRTAQDYANIEGLKVFEGVDYRPSNLKDPAFVPTFASIKADGTPIGFVITYVSPGSGDLNLGQLLKALLAS